jgi:hypothetical protein
LGIDLRVSRGEPTIQPAVVNTMTNSGAIEKAQKNAKEAPVVEALSATQLRAAQLINTPAFLTTEFTGHRVLRRFREDDFDVFLAARARVFCARRSVDS